MYESYWQFAKRPFENLSAPGFYYPCEAHQGALLKLRYIVENHHAAALLTGSSGLGKTLLTQLLLKQLPEQFAPRVHLVFPQMPVPQLLSYLADELTGGRGYGPEQSLAQSVRRIENLLAENAQANRHAVVAIDEAHLLIETGALGALRLLLNFQPHGQSGITLLLVGQPSLLPSLERMSDLEQRLGVKCLLRSLTLEETVCYISHRLTAAGRQEPIFDPRAMEAVYQLSHGVPRRINRICDLALLIGFAEEQTSIGPEQIESVCDELVTVRPE